MFGVSHGAIQFMTYEEMKTCYNQYRNAPIDAKLVSFNLVASFNKYYLNKLMTKLQIDYLSPLQG
jgi:DNA polymerase III alpha subunit (gram-positive type)